MDLKIGVIIGSTRPGRVGAKVAQWYIDQVSEVDGAEFDLIDLAEINLPLLDEPFPPAMAKYQNEHTKKWSELINSYDGFVWVSAEYNHSAPPSLTNAISYLYQEWNRKPVAFVSYGNAGGARAVEHLRGIAGELQMADTRPQVLIGKPWNMFDEHGGIKPELITGDPAAQAEDLVWWASALKHAKSPAYS